MRFFLSYPPNDREAAEIFRNGLDHLGHDVWVRYEKITEDINNSITESIKLQEGIESADIFIALLTQEEISVDQEPLIVYAQHRKIPLIPVAFFRGDGTRGGITAPYSLNDSNALAIDEDRLDDGLQRLVSYSEEVAQSEKKEYVSQVELDAIRQRILDNRGSSTIRVFIAYSRKQRPIAQDLNDLLIKNGKAVFWDAKIKAGATWRQTIQKALDDATHLVVIWTPDAAESDEVEREVSYALGERKVIVPILSKEIPKLPYHLHGLHYIVLEEDLSKIETSLLKAIAQFSDNEDIWQ